MSMEIGGANGVRPLMAAAHLKRPVVDSDTMGRAYPEAQMTSVAVGGLTPYPLTRRRCARLRKHRPQGADLEMGGAGRAQDLRRIRLGRRDLPAAAHRRGGQASGASMARPPRRWRIGRAVREAQRRHDDPVAAILSVEPGKLLYKGKVIDVERRATEGFLRGVVAVRRAWTTGAARA